VAVIRRSRLERIARHLETRVPALGSKLINVLQLQEQTSDEQLNPFTRDLARQAIAGYSQDLREIDFVRLSRTGRWRRDLNMAAFSFGGFLALLGAFHKVTLVELARFADPFGDHPPFSYTELEILDPASEGAEVIYNKNYLVPALAVKIHRNYRQNISSKICRKMLQNLHNRAAAHPHTAGHVQQKPNHLLAYENIRVHLPHGRFACRGRRGVGRFTLDA
jgi:hypothetical protein